MTKAGMLGYILGLCKQADWNKIIGQISPDDMAAYNVGPVLGGTASDILKNVTPSKDNKHGRKLGIEAGSGKILRPRGIASTRVYAFKNRALMHKFLADFNKAKDMDELDSYSDIGDLHTVGLMERAPLLDYMKLRKAVKNPANDVLVGLKRDQRKMMLEALFNTVKTDMDSVIARQRKQ